MFELLVQRRCMKTSEDRSTAEQQPKEWARKGAKIAENPEGTDPLSKALRRASLPSLFRHVFSVPGRTPSGFGTLRPPTQGSSFLATLG